MVRHRNEKLPTCRTQLAAKDYPANDRPKPETGVTGPDNALSELVVYVSAGAKDEGTVPSQVVTFDQHGCMYIKHVTVLHTNQDLKVTNSDPVLHNVHVLAKDNRAFNKSQTPP